MKNKEAEAAKKAYQLMSKIERDDESNPLTLEGVIRSVILKSPGMFQYRDDALGIVYCTLGTGISWIDGRLGDHTPNNYMNMPPQVGGQGCWSHEFGMDESFKAMSGDSPEMQKAMEKIRASLREEHAQKVKAIITTVDEIDKRCQEYRPKEMSWYPISWYACNLCAPIDAQEDFVDGAIETATLICNANPTPGTKRWVVHQRTKQYAHEILQTLMAREE